jgi:sec-independent protein translocase protein TatB
MHFGDSIFIFLLALVLFGPKRLPEIGRQIGKLLAEFRRASNDFKMQIDEELRAMEQQERQKQLEATAAAKPQAEVAQLLTETAAATTTTPEPATSTPPTIMPPSTGEPVSATDWPYNKDLPVAEIDPGYQEAVIKEEQAAHEAANGTGSETTESEQAPIHHG